MESGDRQRRPPDDCDPERPAQTTLVQNDRRRRPSSRTTGADDPRPERSAQTTLVQNDRRRRPSSRRPAQTTLVQTTGADDPRPERSAQTTLVQTTGADDPRPERSAQTTLVQTTARVVSTLHMRPLPKNVETTLAVVFHLSPIFTRFSLKTWISVFQAGAFSGVLSGEAKMPICACRIMASKNGSSASGAGW
jgi:hypothetical protein